jgi:hypothetical protein
MSPIVVFGSVPTVLSSHHRVLVGIRRFLCSKNRTAGLKNTTREHRSTARGTLSRALANHSACCRDGRDPVWVACIYYGRVFICMYVCFFCLCVHNIWCVLYLCGICVYVSFCAYWIKVVTFFEVICVCLRVHGVCVLVVFCSTWQLMCLTFMVHACWCVCICVCFSYVCRYLAGHSVCLYT